jgi:hypothetical protein
MDKVQKYNSFNTNTPSSESYRNYLCYYLVHKSPPLDCILSQMITVHTLTWPALGPTQPPIQRVPGDLSLGVKRPEREADHSASSSADVKECVDLYLCSFNTSSCHGAQLKHREDNFTVYVPLRLVLPSGLFLPGFRLKFYTHSTHTHISACISIWKICGWFQIIHTYIHTYTHTHTHIHTYIHTHTHNTFLNIPTSWCDL